MTESTDLDRLGARMREARMAAGYSQAKCAILLDLSERSYKSYELGKREPPLRKVVEFANRLKVDLKWLIDGEYRIAPSELYDLTDRVAATLFDQATKKALTPRKFGRLTRYVLEQCIAKGTSPEAEAADVLSILQDGTEE